MAYEECKTEVLLLVCEDMFKKHTGTEADRQVLQEKMEMFGDLLLSKSLPKECDEHTSNKVSQ